ncbi:hypothetical protein [Flavobacterium sp.]|uniref:DUF7821 domain-containing protein n=1 Tax=Flavobacterium sp. TaxID=239 RepID=UPI00286B3E4D|nr:hypothetical protein [Flavobacterium sp.]
MKNQFPIINFDCLDKAYQYVLQEEDSQIAINVDGIKKVVQFIFIDVPNSFDNHEDKRELQELNLNTFYDLYNIFLEKVGSGLLDLNDIQEDDSYNFLWIFYETKKRIGDVVEKTNHTFFVQALSDGEKNFDYGIAYTDSEEENFVKKFTDAKYINHKNPDSMAEIEIINQLKIVLDEIGEHADSDFMFTHDRQSTNESDATASDFRTFVKLVSRNKIDENDLERVSNKLFQIANKEIDFTFSLTENTFDLLDELGFVFPWDYKFSASDLEFIISSLIKEEFNFRCPENIFSTDLFKYAQKKLTKIDLELMSLESFGDNFYFFIVNKN